MTKERFQKICGICISLTKYGFMDVTIYEKSACFIYASSKTFEMLKEVRLQEYFHVPLTCTSETKYLHKKIFFNAALY